MKTCNIDGCEKRHYARGFCRMHHARWRRHGDPLAGGTWYATPEEAFLARTEPLCWSDCIVWTGATTSDGYGQLRVNGRVARAHRWAWERENGPIPDDMVIDHTCFERSCVNTRHLRLATRAQNNANRSGAMPGRGIPRGVYRHGRGYAAEVQSGGVRHRLGTFSTPEEASAVAAAKRAVLFGAFAGGA